MPPTFPPETHDALLDHARAYAETVDLDVDLARVSWEVSTRAKRRAGACLYDPAAERVTIRLAWRAARVYDRTEFEAVVRHELVHAWEFQRFGEAGHGEAFRSQADRLDVRTRCPTFTEPRLRLRCTAPDCDWVADRHRASATVTDPERRRCGACRSRYEVEHVPTGRRWLTSEGYRDARGAIGDDW